MESRKVLETAKAFTSQEDMTMGIVNSISKLSSSYFLNVRLVSISTTLATNSVVEGKAIE